MLQKLNERIKGVIAWVIIVIIAITFALFGIDYYMQTHHSSRPQVEVNGEPISAQNLERNFRQARQFSTYQKSGESEQTLRNRVVEDLILNQVSLQAAHKNGFEVTDAQADSAILNIPQFQEDGKFSSQRYEQLLNNNLFTSGTFREEVKQGMLLSQQRFAFIGSSFVLPNEVEHFVNLFLETRDYNYLQIPIKAFINPETISEESAQKYYEEHAKDFIKPEEVSIQYLRLSMDDIKRRMKVSHDQVKQYYEENKNSFHAPARWKIDSINFPISEKASSEELEKAKQEAENAYKTLEEKPELFSKFPESAKGIKEQKEPKEPKEPKMIKADDAASKKEKFVWIMATDPEFNEALTSMTTPEQISKPIQTSQGYKIFKIMDYQPARMKSFEEVQPELALQLTNELSQSAYAQAVEELNDLSYQTPDSLKSASEALKLPIQETKSFSKKDRDSSSLLLKNDQVVSTAFSHEVLKLGNNSEPVQLEDNSVVVIRVKEHKPATQQPYDQVKAYILEALAKKAAIIEAKKFVAEFLAEKNQQEQEKLLNKYKIKWEEVKKSSRSSKKIDPALNDFAFGLSPASHCESRLNGDNFFIVCLKEINKGQLDQLDKERQTSLAQQLESSYGMMDYDLYIKQLLSTAKIIRH